MMKKLLTFLWLLLLPIIANADDSGSCGENVTWSFTENNSTLTISGNGAITDYEQYTPWYNYRNQIKTVIIEEGVSSIGDSCFDEFSFLTSVSLPNSLIRIGVRSFAECTSLAHIEIPNNVTTIDNKAFTGCSSLKSIKLPSGLTKIEYGTFDLTGLTSIDIPDGVKEIGNWAFNECSALKTITIPCNVTVIGEYAFRNCTMLSQINALPTTPPEISSNTFSDYNIPVLVPDGYVDVYKYAQGWSNFTNYINNKYKLSYIVDNELYKEYYYEVGEQIIPEPAPTKYNYTFSGWSEIPETMPANDVTVRGSFTLNNIVNGNLGDNVTFSYNANEKKLTLSGTGAIPDYGYPNYPPYHNFIDNINTVIVEEGITKIGQYVFQGFKNLTSVSLPNSLEDIDYGAFGSCPNLESIDLPSNIKSIGGKAFAYCSSLNSIILPSGLTKIDYAAFSGCNLKKVYIPKGIVEICGHAFIGNNNLEEIVCMSCNIPNTGQDAFKRTDISNCILKVPAKAVNRYSSAEPWSNFKEIVGIQTNDYSLTYMVDGEVYKEYIFEAGEQITPEPEPIKEYYTFSGWSEIPETMPANDVIVTGSFALNSLSGSFGENVNFSFDANTKTLTVSGSGAMTDYSWLNGAPCYGIRDEISTIVVEDGITKIGDADFNGFSNLTSVSLPNSLEIIGGSAFGGCSSLESIDLPNSIRIIQDKAFAACSSLKSIVLPPNIKKIDYATFDGSGLTMVFIPKGVNEIAENAFSDNNALTEIVCMAREVPTTDQTAFLGTNVSNIVLQVPAKSVNKYNAAEPWSNFKEIVGIQIPEYKLTYKVDGEVYKEYILEAGDQITPEPTPTKEGYTFSGWSEIPETMPDNDVTVTGTFAVNKYKLTYRVDGEVYKIYEIEYGTKITPETAPTKEGYTFSGWSEIPETMPPHDVNVIGTFSINKYKLVYKVDDEEYKSFEIEYDTSITPETAPTKEGYTFSGWSEIPETMPAHDVTVTSSFTVNKYKLIYKVDGEEYKTFEIEYGTSITPEAIPTKEGYTFSGWSEIPETMPAHDVTITGSFTVNKYKLIYKVDGEEYKSFEIEYGASITPEAAPTKDGYTFSGWSEVPETMPAHDVTVTGSFTVNKYKLTYLVDGEEYKSFEIDYGAIITPEAEPKREGYIFSGWSWIPSKMPAEDVTVNGTFTKGSYKLIYIVDGEVYKTVGYEYGEAITPEAEPAKVGYTFSGWSEIPATMPANDVIVTGTFTVNKYKLVYKVDGEVYKTVEIAYGETITPEAEPTREGYTFSGWSWVPSKMPAEDVTVVGTFTVNKYKLTYNVDGEVYKTVEVEYGASITPEPAPTKEGYTFSGWSEIPATMPAHDVTITGTFIQVDYNVGDVTYEVSGEGTVTIKGGEQTGSVEISGTVEINGQTYKVTAIAENAFKNNTTITSVTIPDGIQTIGDNAFSGCVSLLVINIGKDITSIGNKAFANVGTASAARTRGESGFVVNCYAESVPQAAIDAFENSPIATGTLLVNDNIVDVYKSTSPWSGFGKIQGFNEAAGIGSIFVDSPNARIYDMQGNRLDKPQKGVNIIRTEDGRSKKIVVK